MQLNFFKYQGTGNDFVILDNRNGEMDKLSISQIHFLCDRRFGIGADGLMLLNQKTGLDFEMKYYNADGKESSMCGNGGRCLVKFALQQGIVRTTYNFLAIDGLHEAEIDEHGLIRLKMQDVDAIELHNADSVLDTGSPHYVKRVNNLMQQDVVGKGREIRYSHAFQPGGINVNFVEQLTEDEIMVRTYERGVEDETLSCGTGVVASAIVNYHNEFGFNEVRVSTRGGKLSVEFDRLQDGRFTNVWLSGPAELVFAGTMNLPE
jgi:diaminopimelate epimerase